VRAAAERCRGGATDPEDPLKLYDAVLFDLFDTVVHFNREKLPLVRANGKEIRSSTPPTFEVVRRTYAQVPFERFHDAFVGAFREAERVRSDTHREVTALERFAMTFRALGLPWDAEAQGVARAGLEVHMHTLASVVECPPEYRATLEWTRARYRTALISNFDHAPTARLILAQHGIADCFESTAISADLGWRKPRAEVFTGVLDAMGIPPRRAAFVGDNAEIDVAGAKGVGMGAIWINRDGGAYPEGLPAPDHAVAALPEIRGVLSPDRTGNIGGAP
jgi:FMN phosphatase YigB (HAD superfamily)